MIRAVERSLTIIPVESDTISVHSEKTPDGTYLSGDVKVAESRIFDNVQTPNIIITNEDGIFTYVDLDFDPSTDTFTFQVNGDIRQYQVENNYVVSGMYMTHDESVHLKMKKGPDVVIDMKKLINEWTVEGSGSSTPIVLTRERVESSGIPEVWQDVLRADVRIVEGEDNILETHNNGQALYVKGVASNIKYQDDLDANIHTVKDGLNEALAIARSKTISLDEKNIIYRKDDGIFAYTNLSYDPTANTLSFSSSTVSGGVDVKEIQLTGVELFTEVRYDSETEELVIKYKDNTGTEHEVRIPLGGLIDEWEPDNHNHTVTLTKTRVLDGKDKLSADVNITLKTDNILVKDGDETLYVKGTADNIKYTSGKTVKDKIDELDALDADTVAKLAAVSAETTANTANIANEISRAVLAETTLSDRISANTANIADEITRAISAETAISGAVTTNKRAIDVIGHNVSGLQSDLNDEVSRATAAEDANTAAIHEEYDRAVSAETAIRTAANALSEKVNIISGNLATEITTRECQILDINEEVDTLTNRVAAEETRSREADLYISGEVTTAKADIAGLKTLTSSHTTALTSINSGLTAEITRATSAETAISGAVASEISRATAKDAELEALVNAATMTYGETTTVRLNKDANNNVTGTLKIANAEDNIVFVDTTNHGVYANVDLTYDGGTNQLTFKSTSQSGVVTKTIQLNGGSLIDSIEYDSEHQNIVIRYTDQHGTIQTVTLPVEELFNDFIVVNPASGSAVELTKTVVGSGQPSTLSARVLLSGLQTNIVRFDSNGLYVDGTPISANTANITELSGKVGTLETVVAQVSGETAQIPGILDTLATHTTRLDGLTSTITGMNNRMDSIEAEYVAMNAKITANTEAIINERARAMGAEEQIELRLQQQIDANEIKTYAGDDSIDLDKRADGTYIKLAKLDAGYL